MSIAIILAVFFGIGNENSYAVEKDRYEDEMKEALEAYENMDTQSQQQMLASVKSVGHANLIGEDVITSIIQVQENQLRLLDSQLKKQSDLVRDGDRQLQKLNELLEVTQATEVAIRNSKDELVVGALLKKLSAEMRSAALESRQQELNESIAALQADVERMRNAADQRFTAAIVQGSLQIAGGVTQVVNSEINVQSQNQQMDMHRLQSLSNMREEAIERMTKYQQLQGTPKD
ncbi:hypothetical protein KHA96_18660 [Bacillus sp. FJAT-49711]|uniref:hypothetical protein n=1 Tax=Bacillus sp. FJAT-49711 TaxID=2833585 RepID=UPI001BC9E8C4|nr:hypothetical protein [Bacillus sp. FJAT-49711]MBS4220326.1 hypothetical protein [Bacillus sp. FJAT-49711]